MAMAWQWQWVRLELECFRWLSNDRTLTERFDSLLLPVCRDEVAVSDVQAGVVEPVEDMNANALGAKDVRSVNR